MSAGARKRLALNALSKDRPDAVWVYADAVNNTNRELICTEVTRVGLPTMADSYLYADAGCLASYAQSIEENMQECVRILDQILHGASPADIPFRQPTRLELVINARTAASLGLAIPPRMRLLADRVIE